MLTQETLGLIPGGGGYPRAEQFSVRVGGAAVSKHGLQPAAVDVGQDRLQGYECLIPGEEFSDD